MLAVAVAADVVVAENRPARQQAPATTPFARSRLPRSLLTAHSVVAGAC